MSLVQGALFFKESPNINVLFRDALSGGQMVLMICQRSGRQLLTRPTVGSQKVVGSNLINRR